MRVYSLTVVLVTLLVCGPAQAQEKSGWGVTVAYPTSVGLLWPVSNAFALRPELTGAWRSSDSTVTDSTGTSSSRGSGDGHSVGAGLSALFYLREWDALRAYLVPRFAYTRSTTTSGVTESIASEYAVTGSLGVEYAFSRRFAIFAELGVGYDRQKGSTTNAGGVIETTTNSVSPKSGIGAVVRF